MNTESTLRPAIAILLGIASMSAGANSGVASVACGVPRALVVIDDQLNQPPWVSDQVRLFRIESPAAAVRAAIASKPCIALLDADPVFATIPGAAVPDLVVRVRTLDMKGAEKSFARRATDAVGRYVSSYLGDHGNGVPTLNQVELGAELLCARGRNVLQLVNAKGTLVEEATGEDNRKRVEDAAGQLAGLLTKLIAEVPVPCTLRTGDANRGEANRNGADRQGAFRDEEKPKQAPKDNVERP